MIQSHFLRKAAVATAASACALASVASGASAHPSVHETTERLLPAAPLPTPIAAGDLVNRKRYVFNDHGYVAVFAETNNAPSVGTNPGGALNYARLPGSYRNQATKTVNNKEAWFSEAGTALQIHATCGGVASLESLANIVAWQGADPFYGYIPFQSTAAGFDDKPSDWVDDVLALTGVNLMTVADPAAACAGLGGTYYPADAFRSPPTPAAPLLPWTSLGSATILEETAKAVAPLNATITAKNTELDGKTAELAAKVADLGQKNAEIAVLKGQIADLQAAKTAADQATAAASANARAATTPLGLALGSTSLTRTTLVAGVKLSLTGPAGERAHVRIVVAPQTRRELKLALRTIAEADVALDAQPTSVTVTPSPATAKALAKLSRSITVSVEVSAGGRTVRTSATVAR